MNQVLSYLVIIGAGAVALMVSSLIGVFMGWQSQRESGRGSPRAPTRPPRLL